LRILLHNIYLRITSYNMTTAVTESKPSAEIESGNSTTTAEVDPEKTIPETPDFENAPDGGTRAWLIAAGGASILFCCLGLSNSFGAFEQYYLTHQLQGQSPDKIAWIGSVSAFLQFAAGMIGGPMFDRYGAGVCHLPQLAFSSFH
jgi:hypothetical protein